MDVDYKESQVMQAVEEMRASKAKIEQEVESTKQATNKSGDFWDSANASQAYHAKSSEITASLDQMNGILQRLSQTVNQGLEDMQQMDKKQASGFQ